MAEYDIKTLEQLFQDMKMVNWPKKEEKCIKYRACLEHEVVSLGSRNIERMGQRGHRPQENSFNH